MSSGRDLIMLPESSNCKGQTNEYTPNNQPLEQNEKPPIVPKTYLFELEHLSDGRRKRGDLVVVGAQLAQVGHVAQGSRQGAQSLGRGLSEE